MGLAANPSVTESEMLLYVHATVAPFLLPQVHQVLSLLECVIFIMFKFDGSYIEPRCPRQVSKQIGRCVIYGVELTRVADVQDYLEHCRSRCIASAHTCSFRYKRSSAS